MMPYIVGRITPPKNQSYTTQLLVQKMGTEIYLQGGHFLLKTSESFGMLENVPSDFLNSDVAP